MSFKRLDFLNADGGEYRSLSDVTSHISDSVHMPNIDGDLSVIGTISDFDEIEQFLESTESHFTTEARFGNLFLLQANSLDVPYYVFHAAKSNFPIWFTTGRKTQDMPETIDAYIASEKDLGRLWISKTQMENLRQRVVDEHPDVLMPYFTASRSRHSDMPAKRRNEFERTIQYYGKDGLDTFEEVKHDYGVLPTNIKFQKANEFKFKFTTRGVFTIKNGGLSEVLNVIENAIERLREVKRAVDTSRYSIKQGKYGNNVQIPESKPWAIELSAPLDQSDVDRFSSEELQDWEFELASETVSIDEQESYYKAELYDKRTRGKTKIRSNENSIRIYPREKTGIDQAIRVFEFVNDQIDPSSVATRV